MQQFKVGDWVRDIVNHTVFQYNGQPYHAGGVEHWQPKEGEWCWFDTGVYNECVRLVQFNSLIDKKYCEPFIGQLPSFLKEQS